MGYSVSDRALANVAQGSLQDAADKSGRSLFDVMADMAALVAIDVSSSMSTRDGKEGATRNDAAEKALRNLQADNPGKIGLIQFSGSAEWRPTGVPDRNGGTTNLAAALELMQPYNGTGLKLFVVSDGEPDSEERCLQLAKKFTSTKIDTVFIGSGEGWRFLKKLADLTGGVFAKSEVPGDLEEPMRLLLSGS
jgi:hypothetical protein